MNEFHWLLARRSISNPQEVAYYVVSRPSETTPGEMARVAGARWAVEESFEKRLFATHGG
jgi:hypothetical protein